MEEPAMLTQQLKKVSSRAGPEVKTILCEVQQRHRLGNGERSGMSCQDKDLHHGGGIVAQ
jgi:hypothetical protein